MSQLSLSPTIAIILAGGKARRYGGQDKGKIIIHGERLIDIIHSRLKPQVDEIIISGTHDYGLELDVVPDVNDAPGGPVGGLFSIWKYLESRDIEGFFTVAVDGPNLPNNLIAALYEQTNSAIAIDEAGRHPTYGWWRMKDLAAAWEKMEGQSSISLNKLADIAGAKPVAWGGNKTFVNINQKDDLDSFVKET